MTVGIGVGLCGALGLVVGSFLNVCIHRLPRRQSVVRPGSRCPACRQPLRWYDNVPVISYLVLRGRCRRCEAPIAWRYPAVELGTAAIFALQFWHLGWQPLLAMRLLFCCAMIVLFVIDLEHRLLPNVITLPGIVLGVGAATLIDPGWASALIGAVAGGGVLFVVGEAYYRVRGEEGLGMGDVKMLAMVGAWLGWSLMLVTLVFASVLGSLVGVGMLALGLGDARYALPFGSFLAVGAVVASVAGDALLRWYLAFY